MRYHPITAAEFADGGNHRMKKACKFYEGQLSLFLNVEGQLYITDKVVPEDAIPWGMPYTRPYKIVFPNKRFWDMDSDSFGRVCCLIGMDRRLLVQKKHEGVYIMDDPISAFLTVYNTEMNSIEGAWDSVSCEGMAISAKNSDAHLFMSNYDIDTGRVMESNERVFVQLDAEKYRKHAWGGRHGLAIRMDGRIVSWGQNLDGCLGLGSDDSFEYAPRPVPIDIPGRFVHVGAGNGVSLAIRDDGDMFVWGKNTYLAFASPNQYLHFWFADMDNRPGVDVFFDSVPRKLGNAKYLSASIVGENVIEMHSPRAGIVALRRDGRIEAIGDNYSNRFGFAGLSGDVGESISSHPTPTLVNNWRSEKSNLYEDASFHGIMWGSGENDAETTGVQFDFQKIKIPTGFDANVSVAFEPSNAQNIFGSFSANNSLVTIHEEGSELGRAWAILKAGESTGTGTLTFTTEGNVYSANLQYEVYIPEMPDRIEIKNHNNPVYVVKGGVFGVDFWLWKNNKRIPLHSTHGVSVTTSGVNLETSLVETTNNGNVSCTAGNQKGTATVTINIGSVSAALQVIVIDDVGEIPSPPPKPKYPPLIIGKKPRPPKPGPTGAGTGDDNYLVIASGPSGSFDGGEILMPGDYYGV